MKTKPCPKCGGQLYYRKGCRKRGYWKCINVRCQFKEVVK